jgi:hypothetical protein
MECSQPSPQSRAETSALRHRDLPRRRLGRGAALQCGATADGTAMHGTEDAGSGPAATTAAEEAATGGGAEVSVGGGRAVP